MWKKFNIKIILVTFTILLIFGSINWFIDPYNIFKNVGKYTNNEIAANLRLFKSVAIRHQQCEILLFGDSEVELGIDPNSITKLTKKQVFNASFVSAQIYEIRKYLELALSIHKPSIVIIGLQMYDFGSLKFTDDFRDEYLESYFPYYKLLLSIDTFEKSFKYVSTSNSKLTYLRNNNGLGLYMDPQAETRKNNFLANEKHYIIDNAPKLNEFKYSDGSSTFDNYLRILKICHDNNIQLILFISPSHARQYEATAVGNGWNTFEDWKRKLVLINEKTAKEEQLKPFDLWDFSGYHKLNSEEVPNTYDKKAKMTYFYESSHYRPKLGNITLDRIFDGNFSGGQDYLDFGVKLTSENLESHLGKIRADRLKWQSIHQKDLADIRALKNQ